MKQWQILPLNGCLTSMTHAPTVHFVLVSTFVLYPTARLLALPPPEDIPEEVLRSEIILDARSPIDGKPLTASEYAELQAQLQTPPPTPPELAPKVRKTLNLLRVRKFLKTFFPFLPIK
jgi:hypothetical protein